MPSIYIICTIISTIICQVFIIYFFCSSRKSTVECTTEPPIHAYTTMRKARYEGKTWRSRCDSVDDFKSQARRSLEDGVGSRDLADLAAAPARSRPVHRASPSTAGASRDLANIAAAPSRPGVSCRRRKLCIQKFDWREVFFSVSTEKFDWWEAKFDSRESEERFRHFF